MNWNSRGFVGGFKELGGLEVEFEGVEEAEVEGVAISAAEAPFLVPRRSKGKLKRNARGAHVHFYASKIIGGEISIRAEEWVEQEREISPSPYTWPTPVAYSFHLPSAAHDPNHPHPCSPASAGRACISMAQREDQREAERREEGGRKGQTRRPFRFFVRHGEKRERMFGLGVNGFDLGPVRPDEGFPLPKKPFLLRLLPSPD
ncbi:hypothetical protein K438DRAFT_1764167 [Mycena galopus ATCC 62051]|nr:hypothetical protein K438DRAFT_1764167 [Mycena galopus ATCC 62051]